jgi:hypothetical protein
VDQVKFVKPVVAEEEVTEEPPKIAWLKAGAETIKEIRCSLSVPVGPSPTKIVEEQSDLTGIEVAWISGRYGLKTVWGF